MPLDVQSVAATSVSGSQLSPASSTSSTMINLIQEHETLYHFLNSLPTKAQRGLFSMDIDYTCIDVSPEYIALGTNVGVVFLYDRLGLTLQRLSCQVSHHLHLRLLKHLVTGSGNCLQRE